MKKDSIGKNTYFLKFSQTSNAQIGISDWLVGIVFITIFSLESLPYIYELISLFPIEWQLGKLPFFPRSGYADAILLWFSFVPTFLVSLFVYKACHALPIRRLISYHHQIRWHRILIAISIIILGYSLISVVEYVLTPSEYEGVKLHTDWHGFFILLAVTLVFLPIQSASEEILCRGYLNQGLSLITRNPWVAFVLTSAFFALLHLANPEADGQVGPYMVDTFIFGMAMCWLSYEDQGLESAIGMHIGNNLFVFVLLGYADPSLPQSAILMAPEPCD